MGVRCVAQFVPNLAAHFWGGITKVYDLILKKDWRFWDSFQNHFEASLAVFLSNIFDFWAKSIHMFFSTETKWRLAGRSLGGGMNLWEFFSLDLATKKHAWPLCYSLKSCWVGQSWITGWWFSILFMFTPIWGFMIQFDEHIFLKGVGSTTNQTKIYGKMGHFGSVLIVQKTCTAIGSVGEVAEFGGVTAHPQTPGLKGFSWEVWWPKLGGVFFSKKVQFFLWFQYFILVELNWEIHGLILVSGKNRTFLTPKLGDKVPSGCILFFWGLKTDQGRDALSWGQMFQALPCCLVKQNDTISFWNVHCRKWTYFIGYAVSSERGVGYYSFGALFAYHRNNHHLVREGLPIIHLGEALSKKIGGQVDIPEERHLEVNSYDCNYKLGWGWGNCQTEVLVILEWKPGGCWTCTDDLPVIEIQHVQWVITSCEMLFPLLGCNCSCQS